MLFSHLSLLLLPLTTAAVHHPPGHTLSADEVISLLSLEPSTEKGHLRETFRDAAHLSCAANRSASTAIYYLLEGAESPSLWHKVDTPEVWHYYAGAPLSLYVADDEGGSQAETLMGPDLAGGMKPQAVVPKDMWQQARSWGEWSLVGTTGEFAFFLLSGYILVQVATANTGAVAPGFEASGVIIKPEGWNPGDP